MAKIVNLKRARKARARAEKEAAAQDNRVRFGTPKSLRDSHHNEAAKDARALEEKRLEPAEKPAD